MAKQQRRKEREIALLGLFGLDFTADGEKAAELIENFKDSEDIQDTLKTSGKYADEIIDAYKDNFNTIDDYISKNLKTGWTLDKLAKTEKAILRLAVTEMLFLENRIPKEIAINEALELTKRYGGDKSTSYINGILNKIAKDELKD